MKNLEHAEHNEKVCKYLDKKPEFTDWVITTAFYSALHYVQHKLFPLVISIRGKRTKITCLDEYFSKNNPHQLNKHSVLAKLVEEKLSEISKDYNKLKDISLTARYHRYNYPREISNDAKKRLQTIKEFCS